MAGMVLPFIFFIFPSWLTKGANGACCLSRHVSFVYIYFGLGVSVRGTSNSIPSVGCAKDFSGRQRRNECYISH